MLISAPKAGKSFLLMNVHRYRGASPGSAFPARKAESSM
jgi:hypothetical protein